MPYAKEQVDRVHKVAKTCERMFLVPSDIATAMALLAVADLSRGCGIHSEEERLLDEAVHQIGRIKAFARSGQPTYCHLCCHPVSLGVNFVSRCKANAEWQRDYVTGRLLRKTPWRKLPKCSKKNMGACPDYKLVQR